MRPNSRPIAIDLFSGAGGMSLGFEQAGFDIALAIERDGHHIATHARNFPYGRSVCGSVTAFDGKAIRDLLGTDRDVDLIFGGPPCQGFSNMGLRDVQDPRNTLVADFARIVLDVRPKAFVMENVTGMRAGATKAVLDDFIARTEAGGYRVTTPVQVLDAADFGVPQSRKRLFVLGIRADAGEPIRYPTVPCPGQPPRPTVAEAIGDLPDVDRHEALFTENDLPYDQEPTLPYARVARGLDADPSDLSRPREWNRAICTGCMRTRHSETSIELYAATPPGQSVPGHKLPRLDPNGIAPTLRAGSDSTHGSYTAPRPIHPFRPRCITAREAARLHGFPDWFTLYPLKWHAYRQIGNAVAPPVARAVGRQVALALGIKPRKPKARPMRLTDEFLLPDERPRSLRRIPQMREFPPVVAHLFAQAFDGKRLRKPTFTFADVQRAIEATGSKIHWTRADTFLPEIARSRNAERILTPVLEAGYSILPVADGEVIGKFVPVGTPGTLEDREAVPIKSSDLHGALRISPVPPMNGDAGAIARLLTEAAVARTLWGGRNPAVQLAGEPDAATREYRVQVKSGRKCHCSYAVVCATPDVPPRSRVARMAAATAADEMVFLLPVTASHLVALKFANCRKRPREEMRVAFELSPE